MKTAIIGSTSYPRPDLVARFVAALPADTIIVSGAAHGPDAWAAWVAWVYGLPDPIIHHADWNKYRRPGFKNPAGVIRNSDIARDADNAGAFWDLKSPGTKDCIKKLMALNKNVIVFGPSGEVYGGEVAALL